MPTKVCLVGVSGFGNMHYNDVLRGVESGRLEIVGAAIINQNEEREKVKRLQSLGCRVHETFDAILAAHGGETDLCMIPTGTPLHKPMTIAAVEAGMNVLVEKPAAGAIQDVLAMQRAADEHQKTVGIAFQHHYDPGTLKAKRLLLDGRIGEISRVKCRAAWPRPQSYYDRNAWAGSLRQGETWVLDTPANNALAHELALMLFWAGDAQRESTFPVAVEAELYRAYDIESADTTALRFATDTGCEVLFLASHACETQTDSYITVEASGGRIEWTRRSWQMYDSQGKMIEEWITPDGAKLRDGMIDAVIAASRGEDVFYCPPLLASAQTLAINAAHSATEIQTVSPPHQIEADGRRWIKGIDQVLVDAFGSGKLFSEIGAHWALKPERFEIPRDVKSFPIQED